MTASECEAIRRRMTYLNEDGPPKSIRLELLYHDLPALMEEVARLQGLLDRQREQLTKMRSDWLRWRDLDGQQARFKAATEIALSNIDELLAAIPPSEGQP